MNRQKLHTIPFSFFSEQSSILESLYEKALYPWDLHLLCKELYTSSTANFSKKYTGVYFVNAQEIFVGKNVQIQQGALIEGPCFLGDEVIVGHGAYIRKGSFLAPRVVVGHATEINRSILFEGAKAPHFNYVGDSIVGAAANLGARVTLTNLRLDQKEVQICWEGEKIATGRRKFGALIGQGVSIGAGSVCNPGAIVSKGVKVAPLSSVVGTI